MQVDDAVRTLVREEDAVCELEQVKEAVCEFVQVDDAERTLVILCCTKVTRAGNLRVI